MCTLSPTRWILFCMVAPLVSTLNPIWRSIIVPFAPFKLCLNIVCGGNFFPLAPPKKPFAPYNYTHTHLLHSACRESRRGGWVGGWGCGCGRVWGGLAWKINPIGRCIIVPFAPLNLRLSQKNTFCSLQLPPTLPRTSACRESRYLYLHTQRA